MVVVTSVMHEFKLHVPVMTKMSVQEAARVLQGLLRVRAIINTELMSDADLQPLRQQPWFPDWLAAQIHEQQVDSC